jgi:hypothetical protein
MAVTFGEVREFNTGRHYAANGQQIKFAEFETESESGIIMWDMSRGITKCLPRPGEVGVCTYLGERTDQIYHGQVNSQYVLHLYDNYIEHKSRIPYEVESAFMRMAR